MNTVKIYILYKNQNKIVRFIQKPKYRTLLKSCAEKNSN